MAADEGRRRFLKIIGMALNPVQHLPVDLSPVEAVKMVVNPVVRRSALASSLVRYFASYQLVDKHGYISSSLPEAQELGEVERMRLVDMGGGGLKSVKFYVLEREEELRALKPTRQQILDAIEEIKNSRTTLSSEAIALRQQQIRSAAESMKRLSNSDGESWAEIDTEIKAKEIQYSQDVYDELHDAELCDGVRELFTDEKPLSVIADADSIFKGEEEYCARIWRNMDRIGANNGEEMINLVDSVIQMPETEYRAEIEKVREIRVKIEKEREDYELEYKRNMAIAVDHASYRKYCYPGEDVPDQMIDGEEVIMKGRRKVEFANRPVSVLWPDMEGHRPVQPLKQSEFKVVERNKSWESAAAKGLKADKWAKWVEEESKTLAKDANIR